VEQVLDVLQVVNLQVEEAQLLQTVQLTQVVELVEVNVILIKVVQELWLYKKIFLNVLQESGVCNQFIVKYQIMNGFQEQQT
jgi:hypothetical protein